MEADDVDPAAFLIALHAAPLRWLLIGRQALIFHGAPVQTQDYDLWLDPGRRNLDRFFRLIRSMEFEGPRRSSEVATAPQFSLYGGLLKVDVFKPRKFTNLDGESLDFASAWSRKVECRAAGDPLKVYIPALEHLRLLKRMRDDPADRLDVEYIDELLRRRT